MKQIKGLDTLRAFAVFFVIITHTGIWFDGTVTNGRFIRDVIIPGGDFGVHLFFVLSGFLITSILLNERKNIESSGGLTIISNFFARRTLRIFPIYYLFILLLYSINYPWVREHVWYCLTYTTNIFCYRTNSWNPVSHTWTLCVEEQFYLIWPWFILFVRGKYLKYVFIVAILTGIVSTWYSVTLTGHLAPFLVNGCFDAFGIGGLYAYARLDSVRTLKMERAIKYLAGCALCIYFYWKYCTFAGWPLGYLFFLSKTVNSIISLWLIILVINNRSERLRKYFLENRLLNHIGKVSYGIYLYHYIYNVLHDPVHKWLIDATEPVPLVSNLIKDTHVYYWIHVAIIILIATLSYYLIEKPFLSLKRFFKYEKR